MVMYNKGIRYMKYLISKHKNIQDIIMYIWQLPQHVVALFIMGILFFDLIYTKRVLDKRIVYIRCIWGCFSLGDYLFVHPNSNKGDLIHLLGHSKQSVRFGWLYMVIVGIPSLLHYIIWRMLGKRWLYNRFYTERWANSIMNMMEKILFMCYYTGVSK